MCVNKKSNVNWFCLNFTNKRGAAHYRFSMDTLWRTPCKVGSTGIYLLSLVIDARGEKRGGEGEIEER